MLLSDRDIRAEVDSGRWAGAPAELAERLRALGRGSRELCRANEILRKACA